MSRLHPHSIRVQAPLFGLSLLLASVSPAAAQFTAYDGFATPGSYRSDGGYADPAAGPSDALVYDEPPVGGNSTGQNPPTTGFSGPWTSTSTLSANVYPRVEQSQLTYTDSEGASLLTSTGQINLFRAVGDPNSGPKEVVRNFDLANSLPGTLFISLLVRYNPAITEFGFSFLSSDGSSTRVFALDTDASTGAMTFTGSGTSAYSAPAGTLTADTTHLLVLQLTNSDLDGGTSTTNGDSMRLYVDPILSSSGANTPTVLGNTGTNFYVAGNSAWSLRTLTIDGAPLGGGSLIFDEIRIGETWESVTEVVPEPSTAGLLVLGLGAVGGWRRRRAS